MSIFERLPDMKLLFCALLFFAACDDPNKTPQQQCMDGAKSVDGVPCCANFFGGGASCQTGDHCIGEEGGFCICENFVWLCGDPPLRFDLAVTSKD
jgi:hypothetical protein